MAYLTGLGAYRRPLIYLFSREHESIPSVKLAMDCLQEVAVKYFGKRLEPGVSVTDQSNGLRVGMQFINSDGYRDRDCGLEPADDESADDEAPLRNEAEARVGEAWGEESDDEQQQNDVQLEKRAPHYSDFAHVAGMARSHAQIYEVT